MTKVYPIIIKNNEQLKTRSIAESVVIILKKYNGFIGYNNEFFVDNIHSLVFETQKNCEEAFKELKQIIDCEICQKNAACDF